jgi:acetoacetyl-CoA synthetase
MTLPLWKPDAERVAQANLSAFMAFVRERSGGGISDSTSLWRWSIERREEFWPAVWDFCHVVSSRRWDQVLIDGDKMPGARWFAGARLNFAENLLRRRDDAPAVIFWNERGHQQTLSFAELAERVAKLARTLRRLNIQPGDRVAAMMPNAPETLVAMLATASIGAIFSSCSPDFGPAGVADRFGQIEPKLLLAVDGYRYAGKSFDLHTKLVETLAQLPSVEATLVVPYLSEKVNLTGIRGAIAWADALAGEPAELEFAQLPFDHPLYILYSSGTTGVPKCIVHSAGGTLLQHLKEHVLHTDLKRDDRLFYFTTCGWMMWNWLVSGLAAEATLVLFDGSPFHPTPNVLFDLIDAVGIRVFGTSAKYLSAIEKEGLCPRETHDLSTLRTILSTGSPLLPESFDYVYRQVKRDVQLASISGGTDIVSCFALGNPLLPVWRGEIQCRGLGMDVAVLDEQGKALAGQKGELACLRAFPSMPIGFWNDPQDEKYRAAYFERFPNLWHHGDYAELTEHLGLIIYGRSDAVLNPGGVRIGTSEIYRQVEQLPEVLESIVVGQDWQGDVRVVLFVRLRPGVELDEALCSKIRQAIRSGTTPRHVPAKILAVSDIPRTKSGKIVELAVRNAIHGQRVKNEHALANPSALAEYAQRPELQE